MDADQRKNRLIQVMQAYRAGNPEDFAVFYELTSGAVFSLLVLRLGNQQDAEDLLQEVYFKIHQHIRSWDPTRGAMGWILRIAHNSAIDALRGRKITAPLADLAELKDASADQLAAKIELEHLLVDLTAEDERLLVQKFVEGKSYEEIASDMKQLEGNLRKRVSRLLKKLKTLGEH